MVYKERGEGDERWGPRDKAGICKEMGRLPQLATNKETERDTSKLNGAQQKENISSALHDLD